MRDDVLQYARHPLEYARRYPIEFGPGLEGRAQVALAARCERARPSDAAQFERDIGWAIGLAAIVSLLLWAMAASVLRWALT